MVRIEIRLFLIEVRRRSIRGPTSESESESDSVRVSVSVNVRVSVGVSVSVSVSVSEKESSAGPRRRHPRRLTPPPVWGFI